MNSDPSRGSPSESAIEREAHAWARVLGTGAPTTQDGETFKAWRAQSPAHERAWVRAARAWRELGQAAHAYAARSPAKMPARPGLSPPGRRWFLAGSATAFASLATVGIMRPPFGLWPSWAETRADYRTVKGEQRSVALDDQQLTVALNTQTSINVSLRDAQPRIELISGEAAIQASRRQPCTVLAGAARMQLTAGDIEIRRLHDDRVHVRCNRGNVQVAHAQVALTLEAGQQLSYDADTLDAPAAIAQGESDWRAGIVSFHDLPLDRAVAEINRYRPGRVVLMNDALARHRLSARYEVKNLDQAIVQIQQLYGASVRRVGDVVFLS
ncbi:FecR family protein [Achromobacter pestifer]